MPLSNDSYPTILSTANPFCVLHAFQDVLTHCFSRGNETIVGPMALITASWYCPPPAAFVALSNPGPLSNPLPTVGPSALTPDSSPHIPPSSCPDLVPDPSTSQDDSEDDSESGEEEDTEEVMVPFDPTTVNEWRSKAVEEYKVDAQRLDRRIHFVSLGTYEEEPCSSPPRSPQWVKESRVARRLFATKQLPMPNWRLSTSTASNPDLASHKRTFDEAGLDVLPPNKRLRCSL